MNSQINSVLEQIRQKLEESAWGPEIAAPSDTTHASSTAGEGGAHNVEDVEDALDMYLSGMVDNIMAQYDATDEDAADVVFACIDELVSGGKMPALPDEDAGADEVAIWIGKATTNGLQRMVDEYARSHAE